MKIYFPNVQRHPCIFRPMTSCADGGGGGDFKTLEICRAFTHPNPKGPDVPSLHSLTEPHIGSFNALFTQGLLELATADIMPRDCKDPVSGTILKFWLEDLSIGKPLLSDQAAFHSSASPCLLPRECRERGITYASRLSARICWMLIGVGGESGENSSSARIQSEVRQLGLVPVMLKSVKCHLNGLSAADLTKVGEEAEELGGYFIVNGIEKLIRLLVVTRRNYPLAIKRPSMASRGAQYTEFGVQMRSVRPDQTSQTITLHLLTDGMVMLRFSHRKAEYLIPLPLILKALVPGLTDKGIWKALVPPSPEFPNQPQDTFVAGRVEGMLREFRKLALSTTPPLATQSACLEWLGEKFRVAFSESDSASSAEIGRMLLERIVLVHLQDHNDSRWDKANMLLMMTGKLYAMAAGKCMPDNPDSPQHHEMLQPGHLWLGYLKERLDQMLNVLKGQIQQEMRRSQGGDKSSGLINQSKGKNNQSNSNTNNSKSSLDLSVCFQRALRKINTDIGKQITYFLATGNLNTRTGMDLQQVTGYTVVAERLNFLRFLAHFRSFHRGAFFTTMKNTEIRKLRPESWGFACPVHTPDGPSCGLLSHLTVSCKITQPLSLEGNSATTNEEQQHLIDMPKSILQLVISLPGTVPFAPLTGSIGFGNPDLHPVILDGRLIAMVWGSHLASVTMSLRKHRISNPGAPLPRDAEIAGVLPALRGAFPGIWIFTGACRLVRPVRHLESGLVDWIGTLEQPFLNILPTPPPVGSQIDLRYSHCELSPNHMLSLIAGITPFSNYNQSPRNMYQCQMAKQTIGTPIHAHPRRADNKLYRLYHGQSPIVRPEIFSRFQLDQYPNGANAVVAVISYTGYDMEDAMILNKSAYERGFAHAAVLKGETWDLGLRRRRGEAFSFRFLMDSLPEPGTPVKQGDVLFKIMDVVSGEVQEQRYKDSEAAYIDQVRLLDSESGANSSSALKESLPLQRIHIKFRIPRNPVIGDKFASRHGQKGVCSQRWPMVDMPWSESGMTPDIIINPHAFPSRMTIGMLIESMGAKAGALEGKAQDATPFSWPQPNQEKATNQSSDQEKILNQSSDQKKRSNQSSSNQPQISSSNINAFPTPVEEFGRLLLKHGYSYYGNEPMYSGIHGCELRADIYLGIVFYQRLRHMVGDKFQVRTTGPVHDLTRQPIKGRKRAGGIRFGEMERDALIAHGGAYLLQDRLVNCSDYGLCWGCRGCGSVVGFLYSVAGAGGSRTAPKCLVCAMKEEEDGGEGGNVVVVAIPHVFRYLATELVSMGVRLKVKF